MGVFGRIRILAGGVISVGFVGVVFNEVGRGLIERVKGQDGPFSQLAGQVESVVPLVLVMLLLAIIVWFIVSSVQEERTVQRRPRR